ncbi:hypothetical protein ACQ4PT_016476 [Festuca glaucescens]
MEAIHGKRTQIEKQLEQREALIEALVFVTRWLNRKLEAGEKLTDTVADHQRIYTATLFLDAEQERLKASWIDLYKREQMNTKELQESRQELIQGLLENMPISGRVVVGIKRMGQLDERPFQLACKRKFRDDDAEGQAASLVSSWQEEIQKTCWHPFTTIQEIVDDNDPKLSQLRLECGDSVCYAVKVALSEINEYSPHGRHVMNEIWNFQEGRKATMTEAIVYILEQLRVADPGLGECEFKLGDALANEAAELGKSFLVYEASAPQDLFGEIRKMKDELESMQAFFRTAERFKDADETTVAFVNQIRGLAFNIEDVTDEFTYKLWDDREGMFLLKAIRRVRQIKTWYRLANYLRDIKADLKRAAERRCRYDLKGVERDAKLTRVGSSNRRPTESVYFKKEDDLVGITENRNLLMKWMKDEEQQHMIITVWGMGGVDKTTLDAHVYNAIKTDFDTCAWISVSHSYEADDLLKQIVEEFRKNDRKKEFPKDVDVTDYRNPVETIRRYLEKKRSVKLMSVLNLQDSSIEGLPNEVFDLFNLRYQGLRRTKIVDLSWHIGRLQNLLVLDAWKSKITNLPVEITRLCKLTHPIVTMKPLIPSMQYVPSIGVPAPIGGMCSLASLQTLLLVESSAEMVNYLGALVLLRSFRISKVQGRHCEKLFIAITNMVHLTRLGIHAYDDEEVLQLDALNPPPLLQNIFLQGN